MNIVFIRSFEDSSIAMCLLKHETSLSIAELFIN